MRHATAAIQLMPFVYTALYIVSLTVALFASEDVVFVFDMLFYASPVVVACFVFLSRLLRMCRWHLTACVLPLFPQAISFFDYYVVQIPVSALTISVTTLLIMAFVLLMTARKTFIK